MFDDDDYKRVEQVAPSWYTLWVLKHPVANSMIVAVVSFILGAIIF